VDVYNLQYSNHYASFVLCILDAATLPTESVVVLVKLKRFLTFGYTYSTTNQCWWEVRLGYVRLN
jgi:hypothetical protein